MENFTETSLLLNLWCISLYAIITITGWRTNVTNSPYYLTHRHHKIQERFLFIGFLIYCMTFWINSDFFGYIVYAKESDTHFKYNILAPMEFGHQIICSFVKGNWIGFRFFCWGSALILYVFTAKKLQINTLNSIFILFASFSNIFSYGRVTLAMALYYFGIACLLNTNHKNKLKNYIVGATCVMSSFLFHSSALLMIALTPITFLPKRFSKITKFTVVCFIILSIVVIFAINILYSDTLLLDETTSSKLNHYSEKESGNSNLWGIISSTLQYLGQYFPIYLIMKCLLRKHNIIKHYIQKLSIITCIIAALSIGFYFSGEGQFVLFYRTLNMAMIPTCLLISYLYVNGIFNKKTYYWAIAFGIISIVQKFAWTIYRDI